MLRRDLSYALLSRELRALDELLSREPENWAEERYIAKRQNQKKGKPRTLTIPSGDPPPPPPNSPV